MSQRMNYNAISPAGIKALGSVYGYVRQSGLPTRLIDLVYLRVSQINGCTYCIDSHSRDFLRGGLPVEHAGCRSNILSWSRFGPRPS